MMDGRIETRTYAELSPRREEILRYAGIGAEPSAPELEALLDGVLADCRTLLSQGRACFAYLPLRREEEGLDLTFAKTPSRDLSRALAGCEGILLFAATAGIGFDRLLLREGKRSPARALLLQAVGTACAEELCDRLCRELDRELREKGYSLCPRFSPGYGDLPLSLQREVFSYLGCPARIGLTLNESLLMSPSKSVTAIAGIRRTAN